MAASKARYIGWSNVRTWRLERIRQLRDRYGWPAPVAVQQQYSYAGELGVTPNQLVLAWLLHHDPAVVALVGARTLEQCEAALPALDLHLSAEQLARLDLDEPVG